MGLNSALGMGAKKAGKLSEQSLKKEIGGELLEAAKNNDWSVDEEKEYRDLLKKEELETAAKQTTQTNPSIQSKPEVVEVKPESVSQKPVEEKINVEVNTQSKNSDIETDKSSDKSEVRTTVREEENKTLDNLNKEEVEEAQKTKVEFDGKKDKAAKDYDDKVNEINKGPPALIKFFTSAKIFWLLAVIDSLMTFPLGFIISGFIGLTFYSIPALLMGNLGSVVLIILFYAVDMALSTILELISLTGVAYPFVAFVDVLPEVFFWFMGIAPYQLLTNALDSYQAKRLRRAKEKYEEKIAYLRKAHGDAIERIKISYAKKKSFIKKSFLFLSPQSISINTQKIVTIFVLIATFILASIGFVGLAPIINFEIMGIILTVVFFVLIYLFMKLNYISDNFVGYIIMMVIAWAGRFLFNGNYLSFAKNIPPAILYLLIIIIAIIYALYEEGFFDIQTMIILYLLLALIVIAPFLQGYLTSDRWHSDWNKKVTEAKAESKNLNLWDSLILFFKIQHGKGSGTYISNGKTEQTHESIGVRIEGITPMKSRFYSNEPVIVDVDYSANALFPILIYTTCKIDGIGSGKVTDPKLVVSKASPSTTKCTFDSLSQGNYVVEVNSMNNFKSTVRIPLKFMDSDFIRTILTLAKNSGTDLTPEKYVGGTQNPLTTAGPIKIGVSNTVIGGVNKLKMPIELNKNILRKQTSKLKFQIQNDGMEGKIATVTKAEFNLPAGLSLENCDFLSNNTLESPSLKDGRWIYTINSGFRDWENLKTISCDLHIDPSYADSFLPPLMHWSAQTLFFTIDYEFLQTKSTSIEVVA